MTILSDATPKEVTGAALIETLKKRIGTAALAGALVPLAMAGTASDADAGGGPPTDPLGRLSHVDGFVNPEDGNFRYSFEVFNRTPLEYGQNPGQNVIVNWELPLFSLEGIDRSSITSPENWTFEIIDIQGNVVANENGDTSGQSQVYNNNDGPYGGYVWDWTPERDPVLFADSDVYGPNPEQFLEPNFILHWFTLFEVIEDEVLRFEPIAEIVEGRSLGGEFDPNNPFESPTFSFLAEDSATNAPYQASWFQQPQTIGDPPIPQGAAIGVPNNATTSVSEPGMLALFGAGLLGLIGLRRRRKSI